MVDGIEPAVSPKTKGPRLHTRKRTEEIPRKAVKEAKVGPANVELTLTHPSQSVCADPRPARFEFVDSRRKSPMISVAPGDKRAML
jgi:hypothetical protein